MAARKTTATKISPAAYIKAIEDPKRRADCAALMALMEKATKQPPVMWGTAIVGFGVFTYPLAGGKTGEICAVGFSSRKGDISIYGVARADGAEKLLASLGPHKHAKGCIYISRMSDIDPKVLTTLITRAFKAKQ
mgnify:FL=1